mgnify:CR=1 FL=1
MLELQRLVVWAVLALALDSIDITWRNELFWAFLALFILADYLARKQGFEAGLEAADDTLELANKILEEAKTYVDNHTAKIATEKQALVDKLTHIIKHKDTHND